ncbi:MAG: 3-deoxy-D-manno-octulosonic acid transferase, partial [Candidatus Omnitrophica bacterium]|nr:3-deoxy-D-manno-octulosonic acid transferase [Candidatus Omnitrophota bacterium]
FLLVCIIYLPVYIFKRKFHTDFGVRFGKIPKDLDLGRPIWVHAVSVGEAMSIRELVAELRQEFPALRFVVSTVTPTGNNIAKSFARQQDFVTYLPFDLSFIVNKVIRRINPKVFIIVETELWPNLIRCFFKNKIPIVVVNCRISDSSFGGYKAFKFIFKPLLKKISLFCCQSKQDALRLEMIGADKNKIRVTGNMKFDLKVANTSFGGSILKLGDNEELLVAGSTHPGEEEIILRIYKDLRKAHPELRLLIAPRRPERSDQICRIVRDAGFYPQLISNFCHCEEAEGRLLRLSSLRGAFYATKQSQRQARNRLRNPNSEIASAPAVPRNDSDSVFILDTIGKLVSFYAIADIVFMGGTMIKKGGHNIIEPAALGKPVIFGPHMFNFRDIAAQFVQSNCAILAHDENELEEKLSFLLDNPESATELGRRAQALVISNRGATHRNIESIKSVL